MNKAFSAPAQFVTVENEQYKINTDFRVWIEISDKLCSNCTVKEKLCFLLVNGYTDKLPPHIEPAVAALLEFMNMNEKGRYKSKGEAVVSFSEDQNLIYAAFRQQYGINLFHEDLHWWEFLILLSALSEDTAFMKIVGYRSVDCGKIRDEARRSFYRKMKKRYRLKKEISDNDIADILISSEI